MIATLDSWVFFFFFLYPPQRLKEYPELKYWMLSNKPLVFDGPNLNYYVLVVSWSYYKYLKGSIYHWDTVYQSRRISCVSKGQWFRHINMWVGNSLCLDLKNTAVKEKKRGMWEVCQWIPLDTLGLNPDGGSFPFSCRGWRRAQKAHHTAMNTSCVALSISPLPLCRRPSPCASSEAA